ncbi:hypothetical protein ACPPVS_13960 [Cellulomonas sp. McL0617]|uniref:hypothetical protein n=1 Tax=Cellulomonas sp. McL0617 TaxID=3415675 RepID=UPI003CE902C5
MGSLGTTRDVVRHEIAHLYQVRLAAAYGLSWSELGGVFGASWTHHTSDCGGAAKQAWGDGMFGGYLP